MEKMQRLGHCDAAQPYNQLVGSVSTIDVSPGARRPLYAVDAWSLMASCVG